MGGLSRGMHDVRRGFAFLGQHPKLWRYVLGPALASAVILALLVASVWHLASGAAAGVTGRLPHLIAAPLGALLAVFLVIVLAAGALMIFAAVAGLVSGPFLERLSEAVEEVLTGVPAPPFSAAHYAKELGRGAGHAVVRILTAVAGALGLFVLSFIPVLGAIAAIGLGGYFAARASAYDCYDAVLGRRELAYREKLAVLATHRRRSLGLGAAVAGMLVVPGLNLVALGIGAIGATLALHEIRLGSSSRQAP